MKYRRLGKSNLMVSEIGFGAWTLALDWWGKKFDDDEAIKMLKKAYDLGINFYQTADVYGKGKSDKLIGEAFKGMKDEIIISSMFGYDIYRNKQVGHDELPQRWDEEYIRFALDQTLSRLNRDRVEVYTLHNPKMEAILDDELFRVMEALREEGKITHYGVGLGPAIGWKEEGIIAMENRNISALITVYNLLEQQPGRDLFDVAKTNDVGVLIRVPDASGILTGKIDANTVFSEKDHRKFRTKEWIINALKKVDNIKHIADARGWSINELSIKFILTEDVVSSILPTITSIEELEEYASFSDGKYLNDDEYEYLKSMYDKNFMVEALVS
ncbi:MAG: general stress protein [Candidatus Nitrosocaldaceae archaeon]|nr:MAG: general stress protein [Candidatus Nitrosocaldaceae archaeon]